MARTKQVARRRAMRSGFVHGRDKRKREGEGEPHGQPLKRSRHHQAPAIAKASDMARFKELLKHVSWRSQHTRSTVPAPSSSSSSSSHSHQSVWEQLPFELCLQIFGQVSWSQLLSCELVCRQWALFLRSWDELWAARFSELWLGGETQDLGEELRKENLRWRDLFCPEVMFGGGVFPLPKPSHPFFLKELSIPHLCFEDSTADSTPLEPEAELLLQSVAQQYLFLMFKGSMQIARREWNEQNKDGDPELQVQHIRQWADEEARKHTPAAQPIPHQPSNTEEHSSSSSSPQRELWDMLTLADPYDKELPDRLREFHEKRWDKQPLRDEMGHTPLHIAFDHVEHFHHEALVDVLAQAMAITAEGEGIELSELLNVTDNEGKTPLMMVKSANWDHGVHESELIVELFEDKEMQPNLFIADKRDWTAFEHVLPIMEDVSGYSDDCCGVTVPHSFEGMPHTRKMKIAWCLLGQPYFTHQNIPILRRLFFGEGEGEEEEEEEEEEKMREVLLWRNELEDNKTLLHHLAEYENADTIVLEWLAQVLNDTETWDRVVNARDGNGWAPLHCAVVAENMEMVQGLLELGADVHALTEEEPKRTALDLAVEQGDREMAALLQDVMSESLEEGHKVTEAEEEKDS